ncbi:MAG: GGDEF domain-containing protein [Chitinophagales bacterium]|jgi:GGDEF domain-containing protein
MAYLVLSFSCLSMEVIHFDMRKGWYSAKGKLNSLAKTDQLAGFNNRKGFPENISEDQRKGSNKANFSMVLIGLDHFK